MEKLPNLFLFDFDQTLSVYGSCYYAEQLAPDKEKLNLKNLDHCYETGHHCWNQRMTEVYRNLAEQGIHTKQLIETFRAIQLSPGTAELFHDINATNGHIVIASNACELVITECLRAQNLFQYVHKIESNPVRQVDPFIIVDPYENPSQTECTLCDPNQCKGLIIDRYRDKKLYDKIIFVGDGANDACPALHLNEGDYAFAKHDEATGKVYYMYELLNNRYSEQLKVDLFLWKTMKDVHEILKKECIL